MRALSLSLVLAMAVAAQDATRSDGLVLVSRQVELEIQENLGLLRMDIKVKNPTDRPLEGDVSLSMPRGSAVHEASILNHIGSSERRAHLLGPDQAAALYAADMSRQLNGTEDPASAGMAAGGGMRPSPQPTAAPASGVAGGLQAGRAAAATPRPALPSGSATGASVSPTSSNGASRLTANGLTGQTTLIRSGTNVSAQVAPKNDPALVERTGPDRYRLRFFPVPPRDTQTVTLRASFEVDREGNAFAATVPIRLESNLIVTGETRTAGRVALSSADALKSVTCASHGFGPIQRDEDGRRFSARIDSLGDGRALTLSYELGFWAKVHDFSTDSGLRGPLPSGALAGFRAVRSARALERAEEVARPALGRASGVVSAYGSFLVIPRNDARDLAREASRELKPDSGPAAAATEEETRDCEFVRSAMNLPARSWAPRCEIHVVSTTDPAKLRWARENGIVSGRSNGLLQGTSFEYVKHGPACKVREPNAEKLKQAAAALK